MLRLNLFKKTVLAASLGFGLFLTGCGSSEQGKVAAQEEKRIQNEQKAQDVRDAINNSFDGESVTDKVKVPDRSAFKTVDENFLELYEIKKYLSKIKDDNNVSRDNDFPLEFIANHRLFDDGDVAMERNSVVKMEKARKSLLPKAKAATQNINDIEYIKIPFGYGAPQHSGPVASIASTRSAKNGEKGILIDFQVDPNSQDINLSNNKYSTLLVGPLSEKEELDIARINLGSKNIKGDAYIIVQRDQRDSISFTPAYVDYQILTDNGDVVYKANVNKFE
ncbi:hypothetical protein HLH17_02060 [Acinetobacter sp. ANC 5380]|uniref:Lipoprotein n=1 Tax=Acinetobacter terrae TaxID=2731247 RepID=A0A7Y2RCX1_9GAMM|nr:hypothetical protein [Acinetobacter terrae]NNH76487.1 hypothetical protein [Acinetobacter terrae]